MAHVRPHHVGCKHLWPKPGEDDLTVASGRQVRDESAVGQSPRLRWLSGGPSVMSLE